MSSVQRVTNNQAELSSPGFLNPPVVETALSVQFADLRGWNATHLGMYYERVRDQYGEFQHEPALPPIVETFPFTPTLPKLKLESQPDAARGLFVAADGCSLVQVQANRLGFNWRRADTTAAYPSYSRNSREFFTQLDAFGEFCTKHKLGPISPTFCEVVYVNQIRPEGHESAAELFAAVFRGVTWETDNSLSHPETISLNRTYVLGENEGRLYAEASVAFDHQRKHLVLFKLTSRVQHLLERTIEESMQFAHDWLVKGFVSLTDERTRKELWGQSNGE